MNIFSRFWDFRQKGTVHANLITSASAIDGMRESRAAMKLAFKHNNVESFKQVLQRVESLFPDILEGQRSVFIAVEALYSMDGDFSPIQQLVAAAKEALPLVDLIFYIDEAHSTGIVGPKGSGFVCHQGLEHEFALRVHSTYRPNPSDSLDIISNHWMNLFLIANSM